MNILALDVGGTHLRSAWVSGGKLRADRRVRANLSDLTGQAGERAGEKLLAALLAHIQERLAEDGAPAVALAMAGFIDRAGVIAASPNLPGVRDFPLQRLLSEALGLPVRVANDALCAARGAWLLETPRPPSLAIFTLGTGVGGGLVLDGRPVVGDGGTAMEIGHLTAVPEGRPCGCGKRGCLEQYASAGGLARLDAGVGGVGRDAKALAEAARHGDTGARRLFEDAGAHLGRAAAGLVLMVDVRTIRFGGGMSRAWGLMESSLHETLDTHLIPPLRGRIDVGPVPPSEVDHIGLTGAADLAESAER